MGAPSEIPKRARVREDAQVSSREAKPTRPGRRQAPRYPVDLTVRVRGGTWRGVVVFRAKDVSRRGLFVVTEAPPDIYTDIRMTLSLPWGGEIALKGRVVYTMAAERARAMRVESGFGVEFRALGDAAKAAVDRLLTHARSEYFSRCVPVRTSADTAADLNPIGNYVLAAVDGQRTIKSIADWLQLDRESTSTVMEELAGMELLEVDPTPSVRQEMIARSRPASAQRHDSEPEAPPEKEEEDSGLRMRRELAKPQEDSVRRLEREPSPPPSALQSSGPVPSRPPSTGREYWDVDTVLRRIATSDARDWNASNKPPVGDPLRAYFALSDGDSEALRAGAQDRLLEAFDRMMDQGPTLRDSLPPASPRGTTGPGTLPSHQIGKDVATSDRCTTAIDRLLHRKSTKAGRY